MRYVFNSCSLALIALVSGCAAAKSITYDEASAFETSLRSKVTSLPQIPEMLYTQPANQSKPCKLPTTKDQLELNNFRTYWDGQCKNGYAYGLGRDIAISDTHHMEEITIHSGSKSEKNAPAVIYDFVNNTVMYIIKGEKYPEASSFSEKIQNNFNEFNMQYTAAVVDASGLTLEVHRSPFYPQQIFLNNDGKVLYVFRDNSSEPVIDPSAPNFIAEIVDPTTNIAGGVTIVRYGNGQIRHFKINGGRKEEVVLPTEYTSHIYEKYQSALKTQAMVNSSIERARQIEREYLHMACNGTHTINGLNKKTSTKICTWRDQYKAPYQEALKKYTEILGQMKQKADDIKRELTIKQQEALERYKAQEVIRQQEALDQDQQEADDQQEAMERQASKNMQTQQLIQQLQEVGQTFQNAGQKILHQSQQYSPPQVMPISPYNSNGTTFREIGGNIIGSGGKIYRRVGNSIISSDGSTCQIVGQNIICN